MAVFCAPVRDLLPQVSYDTARWKKHHLLWYITHAWGTPVLLTLPCDTALIKPLNHPLGIVKGSTRQDFICTVLVGASSEDTHGLARPQHRAEHGGGGGLYAQTRANKIDDANTGGLRKIQPLHSYGCPTCAAIFWK